MSSVGTFPSPLLNPSEKPKWEREHDAFIAMFPDLFPEYEEKYVAVHEGTIIASGADEIDVAMTAYRQFGYQPIFVGRVSRRPPAVVRMPAARRVSQLTVLETE